MKRKYFILIIGILINISLMLFAADGDTVMNRIEINGKKVFLSGMNLAWISFDNDLTNFDQVKFAGALDDIENYKGNTLRWWLHTTGENSPVFTVGKVSGLNPNEIKNLRTALDLAAERGIVISLCLWSFDMLQRDRSESVLERNLNLLQDTAYTNAYIRNALIPMVDSLKGHPAIMCWEVFNEPEGMASDANAWSGWTPTQVSFKYVQQFMNLVAGAIHRTDTNALVSSGAWNVAVCTDITWSGSSSPPNSGNLYSDDTLIAAGGDSLGTLDFYMIHFYAVHGENTSPFHHPASHWELDKPIVVGEFSADSAYYGAFTPTEAYNYLYDNGYAGALSWTWTGHDGNGGIEEAGPAMQDLFSKHPEDLLIDMGAVNRTPDVVNTIPDLAVPRNFLNDTTYMDLRTIFYDFESKSDLNFSIDSIRNAGLFSIDIDADSNIFVSFSIDTVGMSTVAVMATDTGGKSVTTSFLISLYDPDSEDKALLRKTTASTIENTKHYSAYAVDGDDTTRWSTIYTDNQWIAVDMGQECSIQQVKLNWEVAFGREYEIQVSDDGENWTTVYYEPYSNGGVDKVIFDAINARYVKMNGITRATEWGFSLWSFEIYTIQGDNTSPSLAGTIDDQTATVDVQYRLRTTSSAFSDPDEGDKLVYSAVLDDDSELPKWLTFNPYTGVFEGTPSEDDIGTFTIKVTASDIFFESVSTSFNLTVEEAEGINYNNLGSIKIYPNLANSILNIDLQNENINVTIYNVLGNLVYYNNNMKPGNNQISIIEYYKGIYFIVVKSGNFQINRKLVIK